MKLAKYKAIIEGLLFASGDEGVTFNQLTRILERPETMVHDLLTELATDYEQTNRGMMLVQTDNTYHLATKPEHGAYYQKMIESPHRTRLSQAALETLAIIAYAQPVTRLEVEEVRGVNSDRAIQTLQARDLVAEVGRKDTIGRPLLFGTTKAFLFFFGLTSLSELPPLAESVDEEKVNQEADLFLERLAQLEKEPTPKQDDDNTL